MLFCSGWLMDADGWKTRKGRWEYLYSQRFCLPRLIWQLNKISKFPRSSYLQRRNISNHLEETPILNFRPQLLCSTLLELLRQYRGPLAHWIKTNRFTYSLNAAVFFYHLVILILVESSS